MSADRLTDLSQDMRRSGFGAVAERYDRARPTYPDVIFDAVADFGGITTGATVLEIGPGTGQATRSMLARGWSVDAVEIDPAMAEVARRRLGDQVALRVGAFETAPAPDPRVDLVFAATAFHWLDPAIRLDWIAASLRPSGTAAILWSRHVRGGTQAFFDAAQACYARHGGDDPAMDLLDEAHVSQRTTEWTASPMFEDVTARRFPVEIEYGTADYVDLLGTYSDTIALPESDRDALLGCLGDLLDRFGGRIVKRYAFDLVLARRVS